MDKYICSVAMGMLIALLLITLMPILAIISVVFGFLGQIKVNEKEQQ